MLRICDDVVLYFVVAGGWSAALSASSSVCNVNRSWCDDWRCAAILVGERDGQQHLHPRLREDLEECEKFMQMLKRVMLHVVILWLVI